MSKQLEQEKSIYAKKTRAALALVKLDGLILQDAV